MTKYKLNTSMIRIFSGTYNTIWEVLETDDDGNEIDVDYDFDKFMLSIVEEYQGHEAEILRDMDVDFIKSIKFEGCYFSPREYNFRTDSIDFTLDINKAAMLRRVESMLDDKEFDQWLNDNYSSRDGFWSYTPDNTKDLYKAIKNNTDESDQAVAALITYLIRDKIDDCYGIEYMVYEDWSGNGYGGLELTPVKDEA